MALFLISGCAPAPKVISDTNTTTRKVSGKSTLSDETYVTYRNAHENSPKIPQMILDLIHQHMAKKEYLLARFYCDEYRRDFPSGKRRVEVEYLRIKALYLRYKSGHDERVAMQVNGEAKAFLSEYRRTSYHSKVQGLLRQMRQDQNIRYEELAKYYEGKGKPKAAEFYRKKIR